MQIKSPIQSITMKWTYFAESGSQTSQRQKKAQSIVIVNKTVRTNRHNHTQMHSKNKSFFFSPY